MNTLSHVSYGPRAPATLALAGQPAATWSAAEEQALAARLTACRSELLALALLEPSARGELERMTAEVDGHRLRIGAVLELHGEPPELARERLEALRGALAELPAPGADGDALEVEAALALQRALVHAAQLGWDGVERLLQHSWVRRPRAEAGRLEPAHLRPLRRRVRQMDSEIEHIVQRFVSAHQRLVGAVARRYRGLGSSREDLVQEGNIGLLRAVEKFDGARGVPFGSYASLWVRQAIRHALASQARTIRVPAAALARRYSLGRASSRLSRELEREPSPEELAQATGVQVESVAELLRCTTEPLSLDAPRGQDAAFTLGDRLTDPDARSPGDEALAKDSAAHLHDLLGGLSPREQLVLERRFGLGGRDEETLEEIGRSLALTRERVRQIVAQALARLRLETRHAQLEL